MRLSLPAMFITLACLMVLGAAIATLMVVGGPGKARAERMDEQRIEALRRLSGALEREYASRTALPATLADLAHSQDGLEPNALRDPETGADYEYRRTGERTFELCAHFALPSPTGPGSALAASGGPRLFLYHGRAGGVRHGDGALSPG